MSELSRPVETTITSFDVVNLLLEEPGLTIQEISDRLDLAESTAYRHVSTLRERDLVARHEGGFRVGLRFLDVGHRERRQRRLFQAGTEHVDALAENTGKRAYLYSLENNSVRTLYVRRTQSSFKQYTQPGLQNHLHATSGGKAILSQLPDGRIESIVADQGLPALTDETITDLDALLAEVRTARERGYAISSGEAYPNVEGMSVPVQVGGELGAVGIGRSFEHHDASLADEYLDDLLEAAGEIELELRPI